MTSSVRAVARILFSLPFIVLGWEAVREPGGRVTLAANIGIPEPELAVRANGITMVAAGIALALGIVPRLAALVLAGAMVPTTLAGHPYWNETDPQRRAQQRIHFMKNLSMIGGALAVAAAERAST